MKALGTGTRGVRWRDIEVVRYPGRAPTIRLHGSAQRRAERIGLDHLALSLSHSREYAVASVVGESVHGNLVAAPVSVVRAVEFRRRCWPFFRKGIKTRQFALTGYRGVNGRLVETNGHGRRIE